MSARNPTFGLQLEQAAGTLENPGLRRLTLRTSAPLMGAPGNSDSRNTLSEPAIHPSLPVTDPDWDPTSNPVRARTLASSSQLSPDRGKTLASGHDLSPGWAKPRDRRHELSPARGGSSPQTPSLPRPGENLGLEAQALPRSTKALLHAQGAERISPAPVVPPTSRRGSRELPMCCPRALAYLDATFSDSRTASRIPTRTSRPCKVAPRLSP